MMNISKSSIFFFCLFLIGCGDNANHQEHYEKLQSGMIYKTYQSASKTAIPPIIQQINKQSKHKIIEQTTGKKVNIELEENTGHLALGLLWVISMKPTFAMAESHLALQQIKTPQERYQALTILALGMYLKGWPALGQSTSDSASAILEAYPIEGKIKHQHLLSLTASALLSLKQRNAEGVYQAFQGISKATHISWFGKFGIAIANILRGNIGDGISELKALSHDKLVPPTIREDVVKLIQDIEQQLDNGIEAPIIKTQQLGNVILDMILQVDEGTFHELMSKLEGLKDKLN